MFSRRVKKQFPEGTFIPAPKRVMSILQLCLGFTALLYILSTPFMGHHFSIKSRILLYDFVIHKNEAYFNNLKAENRQEILKNYVLLKKAVSISFFEKLQSAFDLLFFKTSIYQRCWVLFAIIIPILLLKKVEGAKDASLIFPLIALGFLINNELHITNPVVNDQVFPNEQVLIDRYLNNKLSDYSIADQQKELLKAWQFYLVEEFAKEKISNDKEIFESQVTKAEFAFHLARLENLPLTTIYDRKKQPLSLMIIYLFWNSLFVFVITRNTNKLKHPQKIPLELIN